MDIEAKRFCHEQDCPLDKSRVTIRVGQLDRTDRGGEPESEPVRGNRELAQAPTIAAEAAQTAGAAYQGSAKVGWKFLPSSALSHTSRL